MNRLIPLALIAAAAAGALVVSGFPSTALGPGSRVYAQTPATPAPAARRAAIPRTADGRPNLQGIWQVRNRAASSVTIAAARDGMPASLGVVDGEIPYQPWAAAKQREHFAARATADPLNHCFLPGVPRIMYMDWPFQIFQTRNAVAMTFEWTQVFRLIHTDGTPHIDGLEFWMGDSRGRWEGDTFVVDVRNFNDKTWFDKAGNFHSEALHLVERFTLTDANTIRYEVTVEDPKVFTRPWKMTMRLHRQTDVSRLLEYQCKAEQSEANGSFEREPRTWYPGPEEAATLPRPSLPPPPARPAAGTPLPARPGAMPPLPTAGKPVPVRRRADGSADIEGMWMSDAGGANYGLSKRAGDALTPPARGVVIDPPSGVLPMQEWAIAEVASRVRPERGYDDPTAHCFVAGVPRSNYVPSPMQILQPPGYVVILHERMSYRIIPLNRKHTLPDHVRLWQGDSVGRWENGSLIVETKNLNGKTWLNEVGEAVSHAQTVTERFTPLDGNVIDYRATVNDPIVYTQPFTIAMPLHRQPDELLEVACLEDDQDLKHLKDVRDEFRAKQKGSVK